MKCRPGTFCLYVSAAIVTILSLAADQTPAQNQSWDTGFIPDDTFFFAGLNVEGLLALEDEDSELRMKLTTAFKRQANINIEGLRQVQVVFGGEYESDGDAMHVKMLFDKAQDWQPLIDVMVEDFEMTEAESDGKKYFQSDTGRAPSIYVADDQTIILAKEARLLKVMGSETGKGFIVDTLADAEGNAHAFIAFEYNDQCDKFMREVSDELSGLPFNLHDIASEAKSGTATVMLDSGEPFIASIVAGDADGADRLKRAADALIALGQIGIPQFRKQMEEIPDFGDGRMKSLVGEMMERAGKGLDVAEAALEGATVEVEDSNVEIKMKVMGGAVEGARAVAQMILFGMTMRAELSEPIAIEDEKE